MNAEDLFSQLFGGGGGMGGMGGGGFFGGMGGGRRGPQGPRRGKDMMHQLKVSLDDLYLGKTSKLALQKNILCGKCNGKGGKDGAVQVCRGCNGQGSRIMMRQMGPLVQQIQQPVKYILLQRLILQSTKCFYSAAIAVELVKLLMRKIVVNNVWVKRL
jgi:DnaJ family protein A protein 2